MRNLSCYQMSSSSRRGSGRSDFFDTSSSKPSSGRKQRDNDGSNRGGGQDISSKLTGLTLLQRPRDGDSPSPGPISLQTTVKPDPRPDTRPDKKTFYGRGIKPRIMKMDSGRSSRVDNTATASTTTSKYIVDRKKFISDGMIFETVLSEYLTDNKNYTVISAVGPQGAGKSTILSMLAGNDPQDMFRHYVFRPGSREAIKSSHYQSVTMNAYISKSRTIFIDCQATNCASLLEDALRHSKSFAEDTERELYLETIRLLSFILHISHTIVVCTDYALDFNLIKLLRIAEMFRIETTDIGIDSRRKVNLVFLQTRAKSQDFSMLVRKRRSMLVQNIFKDSTRYRVSSEEDDSWYPLADIKPRKDTVIGMYSTKAEEHILDFEELVVFEEGIAQLRNRITALPKDNFFDSPNHISEEDWFKLSRNIWTRLFANKSNLINFY